MTLREALNAHLLASTAVAAVVGTRIYPAFAPEGRPEDPLQPTIVYSLIATNREHDLDADGVLEMTTWGMVALAMDPDSPHAAMEAVKSALDGFIGNLGPGYTVQQIVLRSAEDSDAFAAMGIYAVAATFEITAIVP